MAGGIERGWDETKQVLKRGIAAGILGPIIGMGLYLAARSGTFAAASEFYNRKSFGERSPQQSDAERQEVVDQYLDDLELKHDEMAADIDSILRTKDKQYRFLSVPSLVDAGWSALFDAEPLSSIEAADEWRLDVKDIDRHEMTGVYRLLEGMEQQDVVNQLGELVKKDLAKDLQILDGVRIDGTEGIYAVDTGLTELGGTIQEEDGQLQFTPYQPALLGGNTSYYGSFPYQKDRTLANFHLHATGDGYGAMVAGPSEQDRKAAYNMNRASVVVTYVGTDDDGRIQYNMDYVEPDGGHILDLGTYTADIQAPEEDGNTPSSSP